MTQPRLLDLFCGAGGCSVGYHRAGFDVVGVDIESQPRYPFEFIQADALEVLADTDFLSRFDAIHASPPCQAYSALRTVTTAARPELVDTVRVRLREIGLPWVMENVPGAPMLNALTLCGTEFNLTAVSPIRGRVWLRRHRLFESSAWLMGAGGCHCWGKKVIGVYGHGDGGGRGWKGSFRDRKAVMGIDWMTRGELSQAIPPAYTEYIGSQLIDQLEVAA